MRRVPTTDLLRLHSHLVLLFPSPQSWRNLYSCTAVRNTNRDSSFHKSSQMSIECVDGHVVFVRRDEREPSP